MRRRFGLACLAPMFLIATSECTRFGAVYPPRPPSSPGAPIADPSPSRLTAHFSITSAALQAALENAIPKDGEGSFTTLRMERKYRWSRTPVALSFGQGRVGIDTHIAATVELPVSEVKVPLDVHVVAEPILNSEYGVKMQAVDVTVRSPDKRIIVADAVSGVLGSIRDELKAKVQSFSYDLKPQLEEAFTRIAKPIALPIGDAKGCAELRVLGIEASPTIVADGIEKDIGIIVAPQVTLPCAAGSEAPRLPPLANVSTLVPGPFAVTIPIAARYDELAKAMQVTFTNGKYFFSSEYPELYLENPELYSSQNELVLKLHIRGPVHKMGMDTDLDGDLYLTGHPTVIDNELCLPDLEPTIETKNFLLRLKAMVDSDKIRDQARSALRLDIAERLSAVREHLSKELSFQKDGACFNGNVDKIEVTGAHAHASYLRVHVAVTGRAAFRAPCAN